MRPFDALRHRRSGTLTVDASGIQFVSVEHPEETISIQRIYVGLCLGGHNSPQILLFSRERPDDFISTAEFEILDELEFHGYSDAIQIRTLMNARKSTRKTLLGLIIGAFLFATIGFPLAAYLAPAAFVDLLISRESERKMAEFFPRSQERYFPESEVVKNMDVLTEVLQRSSPEIASLKIRIRVAPSSEVNAFAIPGDQMILNTALIEKSETIDELVGVMAHELGHIAERHSMKAIGGSLSLFAGALFLSGVFGNEFASMVMKGFEMEQLKFSRDQERRADQLAMHYLWNAHISPKGLHRFLSRLRASEPSGALGKGLGLFQTHPLTAERLAEIEAMMNSLGDGDFAPLPRTLDEVKRSLREGN